jgi:hypothetical protein
MADPQNPAPAPAPSGRKVDRELEQYRNLMTGSTKASRCRRYSVCCSSLW